MEDDLLYEGLDAPPQLPSVVELRKDLSAVVRERRALEVHLEQLQAEDKQVRTDIKDLTSRACILLTTARMELKRKDEQLLQLRVPEAGITAAEAQWASRQSALPPQPEHRALAQLPTPPSHASDKRRDAADNARGRSVTSSMRPTVIPNAVMLAVSDSD